MPRSFSHSHSRPPVTLLPRKVMPAQSPRAAQRPPRDATILLVDDDPGVLVGLARVIQTEGWRVVTATNGEEALERLHELQPDLLITDLSMGDISGWDLLFHENMQRPDLPIFVITALPPSTAGGADHFATEFFQKPLNLDTLVGAIRRYLGISKPLQLRP
jgi:DNA-binding NtrC family response regulator